MTSKEYRLFEDFMVSNMKDSAHDEQHVFRVLYVALDIAKYEVGVDYDVLICACLLHDIARQEQFDDPSVCHARAGGEKTYQFLVDNEFSREYAEKVKACIATHRFRVDDLPSSIEAKILFDADKIDVVGAVGIARTMLYKGKMSEPLYSLLPDGDVSDGTDDISPSFFQEYKYKLEKIYAAFYTPRGAEIAKERQMAAVEFYNNILKEIKVSHEVGMGLLNQHIVNPTE